MGPCVLLQLQLSEDVTATLIFVLFCKHIICLFVILWSRAAVCQGLSDCDDGVLAGIDPSKYILLTSNQARGPAEFKHINKRRKRN